MMPRRKNASAKRVTINAFLLAATAEGPDNFLDQTRSASDTAEFAAPGTDEGLLTYDQSGVAKLTDQEIDALASYMNGLQ